MRLSIVIVIALLAAAVGFAAAMALKLSTPGVSAGNWLMAGASALGVSFTILAAIWIEEYRATRLEKRGMENLRRVLGDLESALKSASALPVWNNEKRLDFERLYSKLRYLPGVVARYRFVRSSIEVGSPELWYRLDKVDKTLEAHLPILESEADLLGLRQFTEEAYRSFRKTMSESFTWLLMAVGSAKIWADL